MPMISKNPLMMVNLMREGSNPRNWTKKYEGNSSSEKFIKSMKKCYESTIDGHQLFVDF